MLESIRIEMTLFRRYLRIGAGRIDITSTSGMRQDTPRVFLQEHSWYQCSLSGLSMMISDLIRGCHRKTFGNSIGILSGRVTSHGEDLMEPDAPTTGSFMYTCCQDNSPFADMRRVLIMIVAIAVSL